MDYHRHTARDYVALCAHIERQDTMDEYYQYYVVEYNHDGFLLQLYAADEGYLETVDACTFLDIEKLETWAREYSCDVPTLDEALKIMQEMSRKF